MKKLFIIIIFILGISLECLASSVMLTWNMNSEFNISHYNIYYRKTSNYIEIIPTSKCSHIITGLDKDTGYFFSVTAVNTLGYESDKCKEVYLLTYCDVCLGDFDHDGDVDGSDLAIFAKDFGKTNCPR